MQETELEGENLYLNQAGQNWRDSSLKGCSFTPDKTWLTKISQQWIIHILGYLEQNLKHTTDLSLSSAAAATAKSLSRVRFCATQ